MSDRLVEISLHIHVVFTYRLIPKKYVHSGPTQQVLDFF